MALKNNIPMLDLTKENLKRWRKQYYPMTTAPSYDTNRMIIALVDAIAKDKGWNLKEEDKSVSLIEEALMAAVELINIKDKLPHK